MKKQLTAEQIAARDERRWKFRELVSQIAKMPADKRLELCAQAGAVVTVEGRALSITNTMLCIMQGRAVGSPVTVVAGFRQWLKAGRCVKKGEHGMTIWIPLGMSRSDGTQELIGQLEAATESGEDRRFGTATVFDIAQTQELPADEPDLGLGPEQTNCAEIMATA